MVICLKNILALVKIFLRNLSCLILVIIRFLAIIMDDLDIPFIKAYNHWLIWNIPKVEIIPGDIPYGSPVSSFYDAVQGVAYGENRYRGPKQPFFVRNAHRYIFRFYALDCFLCLDSKAKKKDLLKAMHGHIIQQGSIIGKYKR